MSDYSRDAFEAWCESNNIETGRTVCVFEAWAKLQEQRDELLESLKEIVAWVKPEMKPRGYLRVTYNIASKAIQKAEDDK